MSSKTLETVTSSN